MQSHQSKNYYTKKLQLKVFVILNKETKEYYINFFQSKDNYKKYKDHMSYNNNQTRDWICSMREQNFRPCFLILEEITATKYEALLHVIAWTKRFNESNYRNIDETKNEEFSGELHEETEEIYQQVLQFDLEKLLDCCNCCIKSYGKYTCSNKEISVQQTAYRKEETERFGLYLKKSEKEKIAQNAEKANVKFSTYIKLVSLNPNFIIIDDQYLDAVAKETRDLNMYIQNFILTIINTTQYFPSELEEIQNRQKKIQEAWVLARKEIRKYHQMHIKKMYGDDKNDC